MIFFHTQSVGDTTECKTSLVSKPRTLAVALAGRAVARGKVDKYIEGKLAGFSDQQIVEFLIALIDAVRRRNPGVPGQEPDQPSAGP